MRKIPMRQIVLVTLACWLFLAAAPLSTPNQTLCPVMNAPINKQYFVDHGGQRVYFCCPSCKAEFTKDPKKYLEKMKASGIRLESVPEKK